MFCRLVQKTSLICIKRADCFYFANNFNVSVKLVMPRRFQTTWLVGSPSSLFPPYSLVCRKPWVLTQIQIQMKIQNISTWWSHFPPYVFSTGLNMEQLLITLSLPGRTAKPSATRSCSTNRSQLLLHHLTRSFLILAVWYWNCRQEMNFSTTYIKVDQYRPSEYSDGLSPECIWCK